MGKEQEFLTQLKWYAYWQLNQGYALQVKPPKYELLILVELHKIERFSSQYEQELKCLSRCIRRYIWKEENEDNLWCYLKIINIVFEESEKAAAIDDFWGLGRIITYTKCLCACCGELKTDKREVLNKIIDSIQIANAKVALEERWKNIRSSPDGDKAFIDIFQDIFENAITKYETVLKFFDCRFCLIFRAFSPFWFSVVLFLNHKNGCFFNQKPSDVAHHLPHQKAPLVYCTSLLHRCP